MEKKEPWYTDDGNVNQCNHCEKQFSQKTKIRTTIWLIKSTPEYVSKKKKGKILTWEDTWTSIFIAALFTIAKICTQPKCSSTHEWMKRW